MFEHNQHPHVENRKELKPKGVTDHLPNNSKWERFNRFAALHITAFVGTMLCAYLFTGLALLSAPSAFQSGNIIIMVSWVAQTFLQLVLLSVILLGQNLQAEASDHRAELTYKDAEAVLHEALEIQRHLHEQDALIAQILGTIPGSRLVTVRKNNKKAPKLDTPGPSD